MNAKEFLQSIYGENAIEVLYKYYDNSPYKAIPMQQAIEMLNADIEEMKEFLSGYNISNVESKAYESTFKIWKNHLLKVV